MMTASCSSAYYYGIDEPEINDFDEDAAATSYAGSHSRLSTAEADRLDYRSDRATADADMLATWEAEQ